MASFVTISSLSRLFRFPTTKPHYYASPIPSILTSSPKQVSVNRRRLISSSMSAESNELPEDNPGLQSTPDSETKGYFMQQTMLRIKDPKASLDFYSRVLGMSLLKKLDFPDMRFTLYFMGYVNEDTPPVPEDPDPYKRTAWAFGQKATIELTHNWGTEKDKKFKGHHDGNSEPRGFGHIGITVDDTYKACARFSRLNVEYVKKPDDGKMKGIAFIKDPDGYWIEIFDTKTIGEVVKAAASKD